MNKNLLLYGALGFIVYRYIIKQRQTAAAAAGRDPNIITAAQQTRN